MDHRRRRRLADRPIRNFWCDWWAARRAARTIYMIMIIINFTGIIGYRLYLFSSTGPTCLSIPLPPSSPSQPSIFASTPQDRGERIERERKRERERERERERDGYIYKLTKQRYAILKCRGRGRGVD